MSDYKEGTNVEYGYCHCGCGKQTNIIKVNNYGVGLVKGNPRQFCNGHHNKKNMVLRFWEKVNKTGSCWEWTASKKKTGYGLFHSGISSGDRAHRVSWRLVFGEIPNKLHVLHKCDNPGCVNPEHLFLGTQQDNMRDMDIKQRRRDHKGEAHNMAKLTAKQVLEIRNLLKYKTPHKDIAVVYNICRATVSHISTRRLWSHI